MAQNASAHPRSTPVVIDILIKASLILLFLLDQTYWILDFLLASILSLVGLCSPTGRVLPKPGFHPVVVISGASTGIGRETAIQLVRRGYSVFAGVRKEKDGQSLTAEVDQRKKFWKPTLWNRLTGYVPGGNLQYIMLDVSSTSSIVSAVDQVEGFVTQQKPLVALISNAGVPHGGPVELTTREELLSTFTVNVDGAVEFVKVFLPLMRSSLPRGGGRVLFTSSLASVLTAPMMGVYTASKVALNRLASSLRMELAGKGISVSTIEPGVIKTPIWDKATDIVETFGKRPQAEVYKNHLRLANVGTEFRHWIGVPPLYVTFSMIHAVTSMFPLLRYPVGWDSWSGRLLKWIIPERLWEGSAAMPYKF